MSSGTAPTSEEGVAQVDSLSHEGLGVARVDGKAVFIHGALPGETVHFRYQSRKRRYDFASATDILTPSSDRVAPPCPHFGLCGGCALQHLMPAAQLRAKERILLETLAHIGKVQPERVLPALAGATGGYRRRARIGIRLVPKKGGVLVGFRERNSSYITPLQECVVLDARVSALLPAIQQLVTALSCPDRIPQVEIATTDAHVVLVFRHLSPLTDEDVLRLRGFAQAHAVHVYLQAKGPDSIVPVGLEATLHYDLPENVRIAFQPTDFVQVNGVMNRALVAAALELLAVGPADRVVDFFCGIGNFSLPLARRAAAVVGVEGSTEL
ncbi:MAG TPA: 23S rRNA (uracil(1939)-C(5))-methyltransferase RlmD, partial [Acidiferrobacteraceae bacterium]|nr:23S rRNA (uracil(1939)-C(5))-methyltransferase RlmD [Acidiferrobacteraceae bacterium]